MTKVLAAISLLLALFFTALRARSQWHTDQLTWWRDDGPGLLLSSHQRGWLEIQGGIWPHDFKYTFSHGSVVAVALAPSLIWIATNWLKRGRATRRQRDGLCRVCGYDLRATNRICPECGTPPPQIVSS